MRSPAEDQAIIARDDYASMRTGCRQDFNYAPKFGKGRHDHGYHFCAKVTLVDCP